MVGGYGLLRARSGLRGDDNIPTEISMGLGTVVYYEFIW